MKPTSDTKPGHGGARTGAGRPRKAVAPQVVPGAHTTPLEYLLLVMRDVGSSQAQRIRAARAALPYCHAKPVAGKKDAAADAARVASTGRFKPCGPPRLVVKNPP